MHASPTVIFHQQRRVHGCFDNAGQPMPVACQAKAPHTCVSHVLPVLPFPAIGPEQGPLAVVRSDALPRGSFQAYGAGPNCGDDLVAARADWGDRQHDRVTIHFDLQRNAGSADLADPLQMGFRQAA